MPKYKVQLSQYGTVAYRADVEVEAKSSEEAVIKAEKLAVTDDVEWSEADCVDGWEIQSEDVEEIKE
jgi:hypothetical protein